MKAAVARVLGRTQLLSLRRRRQRNSWSISDATWYVGRTAEEGHDEIRRLQNISSPSRPAVMGVRHLKTSAAVSVEADDRFGNKRW